EQLCLAARQLPHAVCIPDLVKKCGHDFALKPYQNTLMRRFRARPPLVTAFIASLLVFIGHGQSRPSSGGVPNPGLPAVEQDTAKFDWTHVAGSRQTAAAAAFRTALQQSRAGGAGDY